MPVARPASPWRRLAAFTYDLFPLAGLWMLTAAIALLAVRGQVDAAHPGDAYRNWLRAALVVVSGAYFAVSWTRGGQTIGGRAWGLRVVTAEGGSPTFARACARFVLACASFAVVALGFAWALFDPLARTWHDLATRTRVVRVVRD